MNPNKVKNRFLWPSDILILMNMANSRRQFGTLLPDEFLHMELTEPCFLEVDERKRAKSVNTFENEYLLSRSDPNKRFLKPGAERYSFNEEQASAIGSKVTVELVRQIVEHNQASCKAYSKRFGREKFEQECKKYKEDYLTEDCRQDIELAQNLSEKLMVLLMFGMFQKYYSQSVRHTVQEFLFKDYKPTIPEHDFKLQPGKEHDRCLVWEKPRFLDTNIPKAKKLSEVYVAPCYCQGDKVVTPSANRKDTAWRSERKDFVAEYMDSIIDADSDEEEPVLSLILGAPGIGKSTLFTWFLNRESMQSDEKRRKFFYKGKRVFLYRFSDLNQEIKWVRDNGEELEAPELLKQILRIMEEADGGVKVSDLEDTILLLDGFDECAASEKQRKDLLCLMAERWGEYCRIFVTCRLNYISGADKLSEKISCITLQTLDQDQLKRFSEKYNDSSTASAAIDAMAPDKLAVFGIPIVWYMILAFHMDIDADTTIGTVYEKLFSENGGVYDRMLENSNWEKGRQNREYKRINIREDQMDEYKRNLTRLSREIAVFIFSHSEKQDVALKDVSSLMEREKIIFRDKNDRRIPLTTILSSGLFMYIDASSGKTEEATLRFVHKSMYEYFMADTIYQMVLDHYKNPDSFIADATLVTMLLSILGVGKLTFEIGDFLCQRFQDFHKNSSKKHELLYKLEAALPGIFDKIDSSHSGELLRGIHSWSKWMYSEKEQSFENILYIIQLLRKAEGLYGENGENKYILFEHIDSSNRDFLTRYLAARHYSGPNNTAFDLSRVDLSNLHLDYADMSGYNLRNIHAKDATFRHANLAFADLRGANLTRAIFTNANMYCCEPSAKMLFDDEKNEIPWTDFEGYLPEIYSEDRPSIGTPVHPEYYTFGTYWEKESDVIRRPEKEPIRWRVLQVKGNRALLLSDQILDVIQFGRCPFPPIDPSRSLIPARSWASSDIRRWLNKDFLQEAFSESERKRICNTVIEEHKNINSNYHAEFYDSSLREGTESLDKIFLLSSQELLKYFAVSEPVRGGNDSEWYHIGKDVLKCKATKYACSRGEYKDEDGYGIWWTRTDGINDANAVYVSRDGDINTRGTNVTSSLGVRPALWIKL